MGGRQTGGFLSGAVPDQVDSTLRAWRSRNPADGPAHAVATVRRVAARAMTQGNSASSQATTVSTLHCGLPATPSLLSIAGTISLVLLLTACGGGGTTGSGRPETTPEASGAFTSYRHNAAAEDLRDHWAGPSAVHANELRLAAIAGAAAATRKSDLARLQARARHGSDAGRTVLRNIAASDVTLVGERSGVAVGRWQGRSAHAFDIEFDFRLAPEISAEQRAIIERAGKLWSNRITDEFAHKHGRYDDLRDVRVPFDIDTNGLVIAVEIVDGPVSYGSARLVNLDRLPDYEPYFGKISLGRQILEDENPWVVPSFAVHEIGHVLGFVDWPPTDPKGAAWARYFDPQQNTWHGPNAVAANGGNPVPLQWLAADGTPVAPFTRGAFPDPSHLGPCSSIMAYCRRLDQTVPSELDFAFLADLGYEILPVESARGADHYGFGAWGRHSAWSVGIERLLLDNGPGAADEFAATADAFGEAPSIPLADSLLQGTATWNGYLIGVDLGTDSLLPVFGDAALTVNLSTFAGIANFGRLRVHQDGTSRPFRSPSLEYAIAVTGNAFADSSLRLEGGFYGPEHDEMAGVLYDTAPDVNLHASFGGTHTP